VKFYKVLIHKLLIFHNFYRYSEIAWTVLEDTRKQFSNAQNWKKLLTFLMDNMVAVNVYHAIYRIMIFKMHIKC
jgi:hypothetical protein